MKSLWNDEEASLCENDDLKLRVYTSRLLGRESSLVLHGGGNTSVKTSVMNLFGESEEVLYVKGSGWDLATIEAQGFAPVRLGILKRMAELDKLSDADMVLNQKAAMLNPSAPTPSVEAILHAVIPFKFVDHTHADAVVTITNTPQGEERIRELYGDRVLVLPYVMPGFVLAKDIFDRTRGLDWSLIDAIVLMHHGVFTFSDDARISYERMIKLVSDAENYLQSQAGPGADEIDMSATINLNDSDLLQLASLRYIISDRMSRPAIIKSNFSQRARDFSNLDNVSELVSRGPLTPDHIIRTRRTPVVIVDDVNDCLDDWANDYEKYFLQHTNGNLCMLDPAPRWIVWPGRGVLSVGASVGDANIVSDIIEHTIPSILHAEGLGGWTALPEKDLFEVEYWELEQAKLNKGGETPEFQGKISIVTGAASGIGKACVERLHQKGCAVAALDINKDVTGMFDSRNVIGIVCDMKNTDDINRSVNQVVRTFGGLDIVVSNAGLFTSSELITELSEDNWENSLALNLTSHQRLIKATSPFLEKGIDPSVVIMASKNVPAPGPGASAYSVAKAGLTQLARIAALELGDKGIRVNVVHPNAVFDTAIWTDEVLENRASHYGMSVEDYKTSNMLKVEVSSKDVSRLVCAMAGQVFSKTTGAQVPIDGGNERVI